MTAFPARSLPADLIAAPTPQFEESLDPYIRVARLTARATDAGIYLVHEESDASGTDVRVEGAGAVADPDSRATQLARRVMLAGEAIALGEVRDGTDVHGFAAFLGVPVGNGETSFHGCLCVVDTVARDWSAEEIAALHHLARMLTRDLARHNLSEERSALRTVVRMLEKAVDNMQLGVTITDPAGRIVYTNPAEARMHGYDVADLLGRDARILGPPESGRRRAEFDQAGTASWTRETVNVRKDGSRFDVLLWSDVVLDERGEPIGMVTCCEDITERKDAEAALRDVAMRDPLTGLPNRTQFHERLAGALERQRSEGRHFAVLFLDLDRFKIVNDSLGHHVGDELLRVVASRLLSCVRPGDTVARFGGDEFAVLLEDTGPSETALSIAQRILRRTSNPMQLRGHELVTSASIGVVQSADYLTDPEHVWQAADMAMYRAKGSGPGQFEVFDRSMHRAAVSRLRMETGLRRALDRGEFRLEYQPVLDLATETVVGFEALVRWDHPEQGPLQPADFIDVAEETGLILRLGEWVLRRACRDAARWPNLRDGTAPWLAVNVARKQLGQPDLLELVRGSLASAKLPASRLRLEITECAIMKSADSAAAALHQLKSLGVRLVLDDFGSGFSSISYLHRLPLDGIKIDRSFVEGLRTGDRQSRLLEGVVLLAQDAGLSVVAEGIVEREQLGVLEALGCDLGQGYLFAPPMAPEAVPAYLEGTLSGTAQWREGA